MNQAIQLIEASKSVLISGHLRADGDCLGAGIVMYYLCQALGKEVKIILPDNPDPRYGFLKEKTAWEIWSGHLPAHDLFLVCDCNELTRLGAMGDVIAQSEVPRLVLDHHPLPADSDIWSAKIHDETAAASGLLAFEIAKEMILIAKQFCKIDFVKFQKRNPKCKLDFFKSCKGYSLGNLIAYKSDKPCWIRFYDDGKFSNCFCCCQL